MNHDLEKFRNAAKGYSFWSDKVNSKLFINCECEANKGVHLSRHSGKIHEHGRFSCESCTYQITILVNSAIKGSF